ncbi:GGDEF domain-containing protein [Mycolicibacterium mucogenicum]|uniref:GGDEF domain-containing protein n=1 Tax=Mycolicibacterium mucogenicum TaxID=56689 RepID=UPI0022697EBA|nr:GGDEF domain-containing protein [Mycolicibacterium mucogenicum]MCX8559555.1 GGDEF domain-containing protein [Mycolicibacterium mucogenicum]
MKQDMYRFTTDALRASGLMTPLRVVIGVMCISMTPVVWTMQFNPNGPHGLIPRLIQLVLGGTPAIVGIMWIVGDWPTFRQSLLFVAWADIALAIGTAFNSTPAARLDGTFHMGLIGVYIAFILGPTVLAAHCAFTLAAMIALSAYCVATHHSGWGDLYIFLAPAISSVIVLPVLIQALIEGARRTALKTFQHATLDPLTGLNNRRGMYARTDELIRNNGSAILVAAIVDLDRFKGLNDVHGHEEGDLALKAVAQALAACMRPGDIAARLGGDEFSALAVVNSDAEATEFVDRLRVALQDITDTVTASVGIAYRRLPLQGNVDNVLRHADRAMYEAKRQGGNRVVQFDVADEFSSASASERHITPVVRQQPRDRDCR